MGVRWRRQTEDLWDVSWGRGHSDACPQPFIAGVLDLGCAMGERGQMSYLGHRSGDKGLRSWLCALPPLGSPPTPPAHPPIATRECCSPQGSVLTLPGSLYTPQVISPALRHKVQTRLVAPSIEDTLVFTFSPDPTSESQG